METSILKFDINLLYLIKTHLYPEDVKTVVGLYDGFNVKDEQNSTLLHYSAEYGNVEIVTYLSYSSAIDAQNNHGETPLILAVKNNIDEDRIIEVLIESGADIYLVDESGTSALQLIVQHKRIKKATLQLFLDKIAIDCINQPEETAKKFYAAKWSLFEMVQFFQNAVLTKMMLQCGYANKADIDAISMDDYRQTSLHMAVRNTDVENVKVLLEYNANMDTKDEKLNTPLSCMYYKYENGDDDEEIDEDDRYGVRMYSKERLDILKLLLDRKTKIDYIDNSEMSLILKYGDKQEVKLFIQSQIEATGTFEYNESVVYQLVANKNPGVIEQLRNQNFNVHAHNNIEDPPLMYAVDYGIASTTEFLLDAGADINFLSKDQRTALIYAVQRMCEDEERSRANIQVLLERGVDVQLNTGDDDLPTIFDAILKEEAFLASELVLAHLALQEAQGKTITQLIRSKINAHDYFKSTFESSKRQLNTETFESINLFELLTTSDKKVERYICDEEISLSIQDFKRTLSENSYFSTILQKRLSKAITMAPLRKKAISIVCKIMQTSYECFPHIVDKIVDQLEQQDMENLIDAVIYKNEQNWSFCDLDLDFVQYY